jgi:hypothetical protein
LVWFTIGGTRDIVGLFDALRTLRRDAADDGRVEDSGIADGFDVEPVGCDGELAGSARVVAPTPAAAAGRR